MKTIKTTKILIITIFAAAFVPSGPLAESKKLTCCEKAVAEGKECENKCCLTAHKNGKSCEKCNPSGEDLKAMKEAKKKAGK